MHIQHLSRDVRYAARGLWRDRPFAATTIATLTVAIALVTVVFAIFNAYVLRPYAVRDPYSLYELRWTTRSAARGPSFESGRTFRWRDYQELQQRSDVFESAIAERHRPVTSAGTRLLAAFVSGNYFDALGGRVQLGRPLAGFDAERPDTGFVAVLSHQGWTRLFDRDPGVVGRTLRLNEQDLSIVGVMAEEFVGLNDTPPDAWVPVSTHGPLIKQDLFGANQPSELAVIVRLRRGTTPQQAAAALDGLMPHLTGRPAPVAAQLQPQATPAPLTLELIAGLSPVFAAFALVLLAACANVSNVMLARANARRAEIAMRLSLGASRARVVAQLLTEGVLIAGLAGIAALGVASLVIRAGLQIFFLTLPPSAAAVARVVPLDLDYRVFVFTLTTAALTTLVFALVPALQATRGALTAALRGETATGVRASSLRHVLVVAQVACSIVLIVVATTLVRNAIALRTMDVGFESGAVHSVTQRSRGENLIPRAFEALGNDPRFAKAALASRSPLFGELPRTFIRTPTAEADSPSAPTESRRLNGVAASYMYVSPEYFDTLRIPLLRGRGFQADEGRSESHVAVISRSAAEALWPGADALGRTFRMWVPAEAPADVIARGNLFSTKEIEGNSWNVVVVGVASDVASEMVYHGRRVPHVYLPTAVGAPHARALLVRGRSNADTREAVESALRPVEANPLALEVVSLDEAVALQMYPLRVASWIGSLLSAIALVLSVSGLYGVMTFGVSQRMKEIGIRLALGATSRAIVRLVLVQSVRLVAIGSGIGLLLSFSVLAVLRASVQLSSVMFLDPAAFSGGALVLAAAAAIAAYVPSRRATQVDPSQVLRGL